MKINLTSRITLLIFVSVVSICSYAEDVDVIYLTGETVAGATFSERLYDYDVTVPPLINCVTKTFRVRSINFSFDQISYIRFEQRTIDAIQNINTEKESVNIDGIYTISGRLVQRDMSNIESLPKGLYIINKKKVVVK